MNSKFQALALAGSAILAMGLGAAPAQAAPASTTAQAKAKILKQLTITKNTDLVFGTVVASAAGGTVTIASNGGQTCTGVTCMTTAATTAASFNVTGSNNVVVKVKAPASVTLNGPATSTPMTAALSVPATLNLGNSGNSSGAVLAIGGTLTVAANQLEGDYSSADFNVEVSYE